MSFTLDVSSTPLCRGMELALAVPVFVVLMHMVTALITRCAEFGKDSLTFQCPGHHVIYDIVLRLGHGNNSRCDDCTERAAHLQREIIKCFWRRSCLVKWNAAQPLTSVDDDPCAELGHNSVTYDVPACVRKYRIFNICDKTNNLTKTYRGVIRSHRGYPASYEILIGRKCRELMKPKSGHYLKIDVDDVSLDDRDRLIIYHHNQHRTEILAKGRTINNITFTVNTGYLEIVFQVSKKTQGVGRGFTVKFEYIKLRNLDSNEAEMVVFSGKTERLQKRTLSKSVAAVGEMIPRNGGTLTFACPSGHVISKLDVLAGVSARNQSVHTRGDCLGQYYSLLTQTLRCYWKNSCRIEKTANLLSMTNILKCLGATPNYLTTRSHACFQKDSIFNICDRTYFIINATKGIIKSHQHYPWHYTTNPIICRKHIRVDRRYGLRIYTEEMDLDPAERGDNIKIFWQIDHKKFMKKLVGVQRLEANFRSGVVEVQFRVSRGSRGGRGFIIKFEPIVHSPGQILEADLDDYSNISRSALRISSVKKLCREKQKARIPLVRGTGSVRWSRRLCRHWSVQRQRFSIRRSGGLRLHRDWEKRGTTRRTYFLRVYNRKQNRQRLLTLPTPRAAATDWLPSSNDD